jgi:hypothetical protein
MEEHDFNKEGDLSYRHCANLRITSNPALPVNKAWQGRKASEAALPREMLFAMSARPGWA